VERPKMLCFSTGEICLPGTGLMVSQAQIELSTVCFVGRRMKQLFSTNPRLRTFVMAQHIEEWQHNIICSVRSVLKHAADYFA